MFVSPLEDINIYICLIDAMGLATLFKRRHSIDRMDTLSSAEDGQVGKAAKHTMERTRRPLVTPSQHYTHLGNISQFENYGNISLVLLRVFVVPSNILVTLAQSTTINNNNNDIV